MSCISKEQKTAIIASFARAEGDTGSPEVQIAILTSEINKINQHLKRQIMHNIPLLSTLKTSNYL